MTDNQKNTEEQSFEEDVLPEEENSGEEVNKEEESDKTSEESDELLHLREENRKLKDSFLRAYAEAENTKKRCQQEIEKNSKYAISSFAKELLSVADNLQRAATSIKESDDEQYKALLQGVEMTQKELTKVFEKFGIKKVDSLDRVFDPNFERVVQEVEDKTKPNGTVIAELQSAYTINDRILREAMVVVSKGGAK